MSGTENRYIQLLAAFSRALGHQLRTPLSVVSNELSYLAATHPGEDISRAVERCKSITAILQQTVIPGGALCDPVRMALGSAVTSFEKAGFIVIGLQTSGIMLRLDDQKFEFLVKQLLLLLQALQPDSARHVTVGYDENRVVLTIALPRQSDLPAHTLDSCVQFFHQGIGANSIIPAMIDALVWSQNGSLTVQGGAEPQFSLEFLRV